MDALIERLGKLVALTSAYLLAVSVGYDFAYLRALGLSFASTPTSLADHVRTAIVWAPATGIWMVLGAGVGVLTGRDFANQPSSVRRVWNRFFGLYVCASALLLVAMMWNAEPFELLLIVISVGAVLGLGRLAVIEGAAQTYGRKVVAAVWGAAMLILWTTFIGHIQGSGLFASGTRFNVEAKLESGPLALTDVGLRRFGSFVIVAEKDRSVHMLADSAIQRVRAVTERPIPARCYLPWVQCPSPAAIATSPPAQAASSASVPIGSATSGPASSAASATSKP